MPQQVQRAVDLRDPVSKLFPTAQEIETVLKSCAFSPVAHAGTGIAS